MKLLKKRSIESKKLIQPELKEPILKLSIEEELLKNKSYYSINNLKAQEFINSRDNLTKISYNEKIGTLYLTYESSVIALSTTSNSVKYLLNYKNNLDYQFKLLSNTKECKLLLIGYNYFNTLYIECNTGLLYSLL